MVSVRVRRRLSAWALPRPSAMASAKLANSTVNHSHRMIWPEKARFGAAGGDVADEQDGGERGDDLDDEHDRVLDHLARIELVQGADERRPDEGGAEEACGVGRAIAVVRLEMCSGPARSAPLSRVQGASDAAEEGGPGHQAEGAEHGQAEHGEDDVREADRPSGPRSIRVAGCGRGRCRARARRMVARRRRGSMARCISAPRREGLAEAAGEVLDDRVRAPAPGRRSGRRR